jgi:predicted TIM-barrel fold metal-dependent hydrolase
LNGSLHRAGARGAERESSMNTASGISAVGIREAVTLLALILGPTVTTVRPAPPPPAAERDAGRLFDCHVHFHDTKPGDLVTVDKWMKAHDVGRCIIHPLAQSRPKNEAERKQMLENYAKYRGRIDRFCMLFPNGAISEEEAVKLLTQEKADGAIGFGEHYGVGLKFDDPLNMRLYAACEKVGLPVMFHMDRTKNLDDKGLPRLENVLKSYPKCILVAHSDWWKNLDDGTCDRLLKKYPNLYADMSCTVGRSTIGRDKKFAREFVIRNADKLLFGSDSGWWSLKTDARPAPEFALIGELELPKDVEAKILRENAVKFFPAPKP